MLDEATREIMRDLFAAVWLDLRAHERRLSAIAMAPGQHLCLEGDDCANLALLLSGQARVYKLHETGPATQSLDIPVTPTFHSNPRLREKAGGRKRPSWASVAAPEPPWPV